MSLMKETGIAPPRKGRHKGSGPTSYWVQDSEKLFDALALKTGEMVADIGCGRGEYCLKAAEIVGPQGVVYALDYWKIYTENLEKQADELGLGNIKPLVADMRERLPLPDNSASTCLLFTVLHATTLKILDVGLGAELGRILQPQGRIAVLELKKEETSFGPPLKQRLSPEQLTTAFAAWHFSPVSITDLGYTRLMILSRQ